MVYEGIIDKSKDYYERLRERKAQLMKDLQGIAIEMREAGCSKASIDEMYQQEEKKEKEDRLADLFLSEERQGK